jgi:uncharacterized protein (TIGR02145 family)
MKGTLTASIILLLAVSIASYSQTIRIAFSGKDVRTGTAVPLDSVRIENLTTSRDTVLRANYIIDLEMATSTDDRLPALPSSLELSGNFANPFEDRTRFQVGTSHSGTIEIGLYSLTGELLVAVHKELLPGGHEFVLNGRSLSPGVYFLVAKDGDNSRSAKILKTSPAITGRPSISYIGNTTKIISTGLRKSQLSFSWRFIGYAAMYAPDSVIAAPSNDTSVVFNLQRFSITIGTQVWMLKNLDVATYRNGDPIPQVTDAAEWAALTTGAWCWYNNAPAQGATYGKLYNWYAVNDSRGLAPAGWHVPTDAEWTTLTEYLGGEAVAGGKMREVGMAHWCCPDTGADNSSGFTALPGGDRGYGGTFYGLTYVGFWWSSTEYSATGAWLRGLGGMSTTRSVSGKKDGFSVRCVRD